MMGGVEFFRPVYEALTARRAKDVQSLRLDGLKIERWLLKVACGIAAASSRSEVVSEAPREWVEILFGARPWPPYFASYWSKREGADSHAEGFKVVTHIDSVTGRPKGITLYGMRLSITLSLGAFEGVPGMRRPDGLTIGKDDKTIDVILDWPEDKSSR